MLGRLKKNTQSYAKARRAGTLETRADIAAESRLPGFASYERARESRGYENRSTLESAVKTIWRITKLLKND